MKQTTFAVSPAFIVKAHKAACTAWKNKLEGMYPSVLTPTVSKITIGQKVRIGTAHDSHVEYMITQIGSGKIALINLETGNRWSDDHIVELGSESVLNISVRSLMKAAGVKKASDLSINRVPLGQGKPSNEKTLTANLADIKSAYEAANTETQKMIKDYFPAAFGPELFDMYKDGKCTITGINGNNVFCGLSAAPSELYSKCLMINQDYGAEPQITQHHLAGKSYWVVTFPKAEK